MRTNKNISGGILLLLIVGLVLVFAITPGRNISESVAERAAGKAERPNVHQQHTVAAGRQTRKPQKTVQIQPVSQAVTLQPAGKLTAYLASRQQAIVGLYGGRETDNPADNVFTVSIDRELQSTDRVWLNYRLAGVADHSGVACSVNDRLAFGGYLVKNDTTLRRQRVQLNAAWLHKGNNRIQFGLPANATYGYKVTDLALEVETNAVTAGELVLNAGRTRYDGKVYIHGFVAGVNNARLTIGNKPVTLRDGGFEYLDAADTTLTVTAQVGKRTVSRVLRFTQAATPDHVYALNTRVEVEKATFRKNKNNSLETDLALLKAPARVMLNTVKLSSTTLRGIDLPAMDMGMTNVTSESRGVRFLPHGQHFGGEGATVALKYDRTKIPDGYTENDIRTYYFDTNTNHWVALERDTVNKELCMVVSKTTHFTDMINGVIKTPESPETQGFAPTMMNDIKAADPTAKIEMIAPPTANNQGSANLSYPIEILPVTGGVNPNLAISYNSDGGSGWLGEGWNLNLPVISVDTRWGVPRYDPKYETETYSLNGTMLATVVNDNENGVVSVGRKGVLYERLVVENGQEPVQFHPVTESDFSLILRYGNSPSNYYWKITNKAGITYTYGTVTGEPENAILKGLVNSFEYNAAGNKELKPKEAIAEWHLSKIEDQYKNFCKINYSVIEDTIIVSSNVKAKELIPESITLGNDNLTFQTIRFIVKAAKKHKRTNSGRYGFLTCSNTLLESIEVNKTNGQTNTLIRKYKAEYGDGEFGTNVLASFNLYYGSETVSTASHNFNYHNNMEISNQNLKIYDTNEETWTIPANQDLTDIDLPALGGSKNTSNSGSLYLGVGAGIGKVGLDVGYNYSQSKMYTNMATTMLDITGDGLPDKLYRSKNSVNVTYLYYMKNNGNGTFSTPVNTYFTENTTSTEVKSYTNGWKGSLGYQFSDKVSAGVNAGMDWLNSTSSTNSYFLDVNNDGLVDIVYDNDVYFNYISKYDNGIAQHAFSKNSGYSPSPLINGQTILRAGSPLKISDNFIVTPPVNPISQLGIYEKSGDPIQRPNDSILAEKRKEYETIPMQDIVRVWEAPYSGNVTIASSVQLVTTYGNTDADGVRVAIQHKEQEIWYRVITNNENSLISTSNNINIIAGEKIYFRVQSGNSEFADASGDVVKWSPIITYTDRPQTIDFNGYNDAVYKVSEGAFVNKIGYNLLDSVEASTVAVKGKFTKPVTSNDITLNIYLTNDSLLYNEMEKDTIILDSISGKLDTLRIKKVTEYVNPSFHPKELISSIPFNASVEMNNSELDLGYLKSLAGVNHYRFEIVSSTNVCWDKIKWTPEIHCRMNGVDTVIYAGVMYDVKKQIGTSRNTLQPGPTLLQKMSFTPELYNYSNHTINTTLTLRIKYGNGLVSEKQWPIVDDQIQFSNEYSLDVYYGNLVSQGEVYTAQVFLADTLDINNIQIPLKVFNYFQYITELEDYYSPNYNNPLFIPVRDGYKVSQNSYDYWCVEENAGVEILCKKSNRELDFGHMWRGWGQFEYNANDGRYARPIEEDKLYIPADTALAKITNEWGIKNMRMFSINPEPTTKKYWTGLNEHLFIIGDTISVGRLNMAEMPNLVRYSSPGGPYRAPSNQEVNNTPTVLKDYSKQLSLLTPYNSNLITAPEPPLDNSLNDDLYTIDKAPNLSSKQESRTWWGGASVSIGKFDGSVSASGSVGNSKVTSAFQDMNGDGYPDYITDTQIEYTNRHGGRDKEVAGYIKTYDNQIKWVTGNGNISDRLTANESSNSFSIGVSGGYSPSAGFIKLSESSSFTNSMLSQKTTYLAMDKSPSASASGSYTKNNSTTTNTYIDINGDGLPDRVFYKDSKIFVCLNLGYSFSEPTDWGLVTVNCISHIASDGVSIAASGGYGATLGIFESLIKLDKTSIKLLKPVLTKLSVGLSASVNGAKTESYSLYAIRDINMDGMPDKLYKNGSSFAIALNKGTGFTNAITVNNIDNLYKLITKATSSNLSLNLTIRIAWFRFTIGGGGSFGFGSEYTTTDLMDIDGDGYPDFVKADENDKTKLYVRKSKIQYTNKLKSFTNPLGGVVTIDYERSKASFDHPGGKWVMKSVAMYDGVTDDGEGTDSITVKNEFEYGSGRYDRYEREFLGFGEVASYNNQIVNSAWKRYRGSKQFFLTDNIYHKGMLSKSEVYDLTGNEPRVYAESTTKNYDYSVKRIANSNNANAGKYQLENVDLSRYNMFNNQYIVYSPLKYAKNSNYGYNAQNNWVNITTSETYSEYNTNAGTHGEMTLYKFSDKGQLGETGTGTYNYRAVMTYLDSTNMTLFCLPKTHTVYDGASATKVLRKTEYYWWPGYASQLKTVINHIDTVNAVKAVTDITYDGYGNVQNKILPANHRGQRMWYQYDYDPVYHMYPVKITDANGYTSEMPEYDYRFGIPLKTIDINGNVMTQTVDNRGRIVKVTGPNEYNASDTSKYTIKFIYNPQKIVKNGSTYSAMPYAITRHYDATKATGSDDDKNLETVTFVDGFGRPIQVKKESMVWGGTSNVHVMIVSGRAKFDAMGRTVEASYPVTETYSANDMIKFNKTFDSYKTLTSYDVLDRVTKTVLPDGASTKMDYHILNDTLVTTVTDALGRKQRTYTNGSGLTVKTVQRPDSCGIVTLFAYDAINQLVQVTDAASKPTISVYDMAGRRTQVSHPASGITRFEYDKAGNVIARQTANMLVNNGTKKIQYFYTYNRLDSIVYPDHKENNVKYIYGSSTEKGFTYGNRAGRIKYMEDGTGGQEFTYGKLGELIALTRTLVIPNQAVATYTTQWQYDSWNRLKSMTYPDGEVVAYNYNIGGLLTKVRGDKTGTYNGLVDTCTYVRQINYDKFEQRTYLMYGNGKETNYTYDNRNRQLKFLKVGVGNSYIMNNEYEYDSIGNVTKISNTGSSANNIGGSITHNYGYDNLYRLTSANGNFTGNNGKKANYTLEMHYDNMHNITYKKQDVVQKGIQFNGILNAGYELSYTYAGNSQQISNIADENYRVERAGDNYAVGSLATDTITRKEQEFSYDANGNLIFTVKGKVKDNKLQATNTRKLLWDEENRLLAISDNGFVSNYWYDAAGERTVKESFDNEGVYVNGALSGARTGTTKYTAYISPYLVLNNGGNYTKHIYVGSQRIVSKWGNSSIFDAERPTDADAAMINDFSKKYTLQTNNIKTRFDSLGVNFKGKVYSGMNANPESDALGQGTNALPFKYFYHPDHLGSSSLITDGNGYLVQNIQYVPFGEVFVEERNANWSTPYKFNGKEQDEETGLCYYGARYYDPRTSVWLSVDPLAEKYPNIGGYVYCANNPVKYVDFDGRDLVHINNSGSVIRVTQNNSPDIKVVYPDGHTVALSDINFNGSFFCWNNDNRQVVANVVGYYGRLAGVSNIHAGVFVDDESLASTGLWNNIWVQPTSAGGLPSPLNNKFDLMSVLIHEQYHQKESRDGEYTYTKHASVYLKQAQHSTFKRTSKDFSEGQMGNLVRYLTAAKSKADNYDSEKGYKDIIKQFNESNVRGGYKIVDRDSGGMQLLNPQGKEVFVPLEPLESPH